MDIRSESVNSFAHSQIDTLHSSRFDLLHSIFGNYEPTCYRLKRMEPLILPPTPTPLGWPSVRFINLGQRASIQKHKHPQVAACKTYQVTIAQLS
jgi:hypothetical protein